LRFKSKETQSMHDPVAQWGEKMMPSNWVCE